MLAKCLTKDGKSEGERSAPLDLLALQTLDVLQGDDDKLVSLAEAWSVPSWALQAHQKLFSPPPPLHYTTTLPL